MKQNIFNLTLVISLIGIFLLLFLSYSLSPDLIDIEKIDNKSINKQVKIQGKIINIKDKQSFKILQIQDNTGKINILCNCKDNIKQNQTLIIVGKIQEYKEVLQISADKILST